MSLFPAPPRSPQKLTGTSPPSNAVGNTGPTQVEKQAMIDDLQLEISKRARGLRSIYNEQARQLRETIERRIHRIPPRMRNKTMGDLVDEQAKKAANIKPASKAIEASPAKTAKRSSTVAFSTDDKENGAPELDLQKKRAKLSKEQNAAQSKVSVLSPRSHNSRQLPSRMGSPEKSLASPQKPRSASRAVSRQGTTAARKPAAKKATTTQESDSRDSEGSAISSRTTIVKKPAEAKRAIAKKVVAKAPTTTTRKRAAPTKAEAPPAATRTLRKRG